MFGFTSTKIQIILAGQLRNIKIQNKMAPYRVAAMIISTMLDFHARRGARKATGTRYFVTVSNFAIFCFRLLTLTWHCCTLMMSTLHWPFLTYFVLFEFLDVHSI